MQIKQTITLFGTVSNSATSRISKNGRKYTAFGFLAWSLDAEERRSCHRDSSHARLEPH
ncbi:MAG: hypothetical protein ACYCOX_02765 [Acidobacteriaceae bacterium]